MLHIDGYLCEVKDVQIRDGLHMLGAAPAGEAQVNLVLAVLRATQVWGGRRALPGLRAALAAWAGLDEQALLAAPGAPVPHRPAPCANGTFAHDRQCARSGAGRARVRRGAAPGAARRGGRGPAVTGADLVDVLEGVARALVAGVQARGWTEPAAVVRELLGEEVPDVVAVLEFGCAEVVPRLDRTTDEIAHVLHALDGGYVPAGPSGSPTRGLVNVLPTGRNFYSVDPKAIPSRSAWEVGSRAGRLAAGPAPGRHRGLPALGRAHRLGHRGDAHPGRRPRRDPGADRLPAGLGRGVAAGHRLRGRARSTSSAGRASTSRCASPASSGTRSRTSSRCWTTRSGRWPSWTSRPSRTTCARTSRRTRPRHGDRRRATSRIFGSKPGAYGAGLLPLIDARNWRSDADLAEVYAVWGGYAYGRGLDGREARADMEASFRRIAVAAKNQDTREHDIVDSDDYFQYHGGMVATVRALTGRSPAAYVGDSAVTDAVRTRTLAEETKRVFRARVVNPKWIAAMQRHGYKGAFELAATVDYLFGYDATAGVVDDWMYGQLAESYVFDETNRQFMEQVQPVGAARDHRAAAGGGRPRACGPSPTTPCWTGCDRPTWTSKAIWRARSERHVAGRRRGRAGRPGPGHGAGGRPCWPRPTWCSSRSPTPGRPGAPSGPRCSTPRRGGSSGWCSR